MFEYSSMFTFRVMKYSIEYSHFQSFNTPNFDGSEKLRQAEAEVVPSSAQAPAQLGLSWLYFQVIQPPPPPPGEVFSQLQLTKYI